MNDNINSRYRILEVPMRKENPRRVWSLNTRHWSI